MRQNRVMKRVWLWIALGSLFVAGCSKEPQRVGGIGREKNYATAVSLSPSTTELMASQFYIVKLVGRSQSCNFPPGIQKTPVVAGVKPYYEKITALKPDLVIFDGSLYNETDLQKMKQLKWDTYDFSPQTVPEYIDQLQLLAAKIGNETNADEIIIKIRDVIKANKLQALPREVKIAAILTGANKDYMIAGDGTFLADVMRNSGATVVAPKAPNFVALSAEMLIRENPDIIITSGDNQMILKDPRFSTVKAVKNNKVAKIDPDVMLRSGVRIEIMLRDLGVLVRKTANNQ